MRNIIVVANQMKDMFESENTKAEIESVIKSARVAAPEVMYLHWNELHDVMISNLPEDRKQWSNHDLSIVSTFSGNPVEEIKAENNSE